MQGQEFDRAWLYGNVAGHTKAVLMFRDAAQECQNPQLKQYAQETLPTLRQHLEHAQKIAQFDEATTAGATERASDRSSSERSGDRSSGRSGSSERGSRSSSGTGSGRGITDGNSDSTGTAGQNRPASGTNR